MKVGSQFKVDAEDAYRELERIKAEGELTADTLLESAKDKDNVLHSEFEWNNRKAAHEYRKTQASKMIRSVEVVIEKMPKKSTRVYEVTVAKDRVAHKTGKPRRVYSNIEEIMSDPEDRQYLIGEAIKDLIRVRQRYSLLQELAVVWSDIDKVAEEHAG